MMMKRTKLLARLLLRVSSNQQLEADGDLSVQRQLVLDFIEKHEEWELDSKEYFEGSNSGYKVSVENRDTLQEALKDAERGEYDILVCYKDDRIGRRMWEIGSYVMELKQCGVDIYTVKDGCISPQTDDIMGQMMLALRYGNAQKSSSDTGMRVKDTAQKLVQRGKFMGGKAPYGYELVYSGEISKHGRALKKLQIVEEKVNVVKYIYELSYNKEFGSSKIAKILNAHEKYKKLAPNDYWKHGTITSILTNPVYAGRVAYKRRERVNGKIHRLSNDEWIKSAEIDESIKIIDEDVWDAIQEKRGMRNKVLTDRNRYANVIKKNDGLLPLIDVAHCGYCGCKLTNGTKYNYWTIKETGERRASKMNIYRCTNALNGVPHGKTYSFRADTYESIIFDEIANYIEKLNKSKSLDAEIHKSENSQVDELKTELNELNKKRNKIENGISIMESHIPDAMTGEYALTVEELAKAIRSHKDNLYNTEEEIKDVEEKIAKYKVSDKQKESIYNLVATWKDVFLNADKPTKRVLINKVVSRIDIKKDEINIRYRFKIEDF